MTKDKLELTVKCPWCTKGETLADKPADIRISTRCNVCKQFYRIDFKTLEVVKGQAMPRRALRKIVEVKI